MRLDSALVARRYATDEFHAKALVAAGLVMVDDVKALRSDTPVDPENAVITVLRRQSSWVSRGGDKLVSALDAFRVDVTGAVALDCGASTGGFTDVLLARGARLVYAVDVGFGLLADKLRNDPKVVVMERTHVRRLQPLPAPPAIVTMDLSFISLRGVLPVIAGIAPGAVVVALFKPQFELPRASVNQRGVVIDPDEGARAAQEFAAWAESSSLARLLSEPFPSALAGRNGNQEWFLHLGIPDRTGA